MTQTSLLLRFGIVELDGFFMSSSSPQVLQSILCRAFELPPTDISISYRSPGPGGDVWLPMLSDWDLDTAILGSADHDLHLQVRRRVSPKKATES